MFIDSDIISKLINIRIKEQVPWKELPNKYSELLPEENIPDWRTLQKAMLEDYERYTLPPHLHRKMRSRLEDRL